MKREFREKGPLVQSSSRTRPPVHATNPAAPSTVSTILPELLGFEGPKNPELIGVLQRGPLQAFSGTEAHRAPHVEDSSLARALLHFHDTLEWYLEGQATSFLAPNCILVNRV